MKQYRLNIKQIAIGVITFIGVIIPWSLYQKFIDPPGNRLLKWQLAGDVPVNNKSFLQALSDAYGALSIKQIFMNKLANIILILPEIKQFFSIEKIRFQLFDNTLTAPGIMDVGFILMIVIFVSKLRRNEKIRIPQNSLSYLLSIHLLIYVFVWSLLLFGPSATSIHQGSYISIIFLFILLSLAISHFKDWFMSIVFYVNIAFFAGVWIWKDTGSFKQFTVNIPISICTAICFIILILYLNQLRRETLIVTKAKAKTSDSNGRKKAHFFPQSVD